MSKYGLRADWFSRYCPQVCGSGYVNYFLLKCQSIAIWWSLHTQQVGISYFRRYDAGVSWWEQDHENRESSRFFSDVDIHSLPALIVSPGGLASSMHDRLLIRNSRRAKCRSATITAIVCRLPICTATPYTRVAMQPERQVCNNDSFEEQQRKAQSCALLHLLAPFVEPPNRGLLC